MKSVSIVIPVYNEEEILHTSISRLLKALKSLKVKDIEILLVENGSTDKTLSILRKLKKKSRWIKVLQLPHPNFGEAVRLGILSSSKEYVCLFNTDWWNIQFLKSAYKLRHTENIIVASKTLRGKDDQRPLIRKLGTRLLVLITNILYRYKGSDTHGLKLMNRRKILPLLKKCETREIIETELLIRAQRKGLRIKEIPCKVQEIRPARTSIFNRGPKVMRELILLARSLE